MSACEHSQAALTARQARAAQRTSGRSPARYQCWPWRHSAAALQCLHGRRAPPRSASARQRFWVKFDTARASSAWSCAPLSAESAASVRSVRCDTAGAAAPQPLSAVLGLKRSLRHGTANVAIPSHTAPPARPQPTAPLRVPRPAVPRWACVDV